MSRENWFLAFPVDGAFVLDLPELPRALRRYHPEDVHLTLAFFGRCGEARALGALSRFDELVHGSPLEAFDVSLGDVVPMGGSRGRYTALAALLEEGRAEATARLTAYRDVLIEAATGRRPKRPAKPHVTLARPRGRATAADREAGIAWGAALDLGAVRARLDRVALYTWSEIRRERLFRIVAERSLGDSDS